MVEFFLNEVETQTKKQSNNKVNVQ